MSRLACVALLLAACAAGWAQLAPARKEVRRPVADLGGEAYHFTTLRAGPCARHVVYLDVRNGRTAVVTDGVPGPLVDVLADDALRFSPDGARLAYAAQDDDGWWAIIDGAKQGPYAAMAGSPVFSPDGAHVAYAVQEDDGWHVVLDGARGPACERLFGLTMTPDGTPAYAALRDGQWRVVAGAQESAPARVIWDFAVGIGGRMAGVVTPRADLRAVTVDGTTARSYAGISQLRFSPDGAHLAYVASSPAGDRVVLDGVEGPLYPIVLPDSLTFSPNGTRLAYVAGMAGGKSVAVIDGAASRAYATVGMPVFSPDSAHVAAVVSTGRTRVQVVRDGVEGATYNEVSDLTFLADGTVAYLARIGVTDRTLVVGETPALLGDARADHVVPGTLAPAPAGARLACLMEAPDGSQTVAVFDGIAGAPGSSFAAIAGNRPCFADAGKLRYFARTGSNIEMVEETVAKAE